MAGIYIHIPFCKQACHYCNFHFSTSMRKMAELVTAIIKEIELTGSSHNSQNKKIAERIQTIYFGGGTPSLLSNDEINLILKTIAKNFTIDPHAEVSLEANPDDVIAKKLDGWKRSGINRLSLGIQSFFEQDLQWMNRAHNAQQAINALLLAKKYIDNITIDLIYGTPGLSNLRWKENVDKAITAGVQHLSCYALTVEPKTPLQKLIRLQKKAAVNTSQQSEQFLLLMDWMQQAGYEHYEISNFAKPNYRSRHNSAYWQGKHYIGIGPAAHSYNGHSRYWNIANNQQYIDAISKGNLPFEKEILTPVQKTNEYIMTSLRTIEGLNLEMISDNYLQAIMPIAQKYVAQNLLIRKNHSLQLTREGKLYADGIAADMFQSD